MASRCYRYFLKPRNSNADDERSPLMRDLILYLLDTVSYEQWLLCNVVFTVACLLLGFWLDCRAAGRDRHKEQRENVTPPTFARAALTEAPDQAQVELALP
jgi:hypothetical protein